MNVQAFFGVFLLAGIVTQLGCSKGPKAPTTVPVSGVIKYKGEPLAGATVTFQQKDVGSVETAAHPAHGTTDDQGRYVLTTYVNPKEFSGAVPGDYVVTVTKIETTAGGEPDYKKMYSQMNENVPREGSVKGDQAMQKMAQATGPKSSVPLKYRSTMTTDLAASVKPSGSQTFDFDLTD
jgi:hypothetical protein